jgi:hypothetical protein
MRAALGGTAAAAFALMLASGSGCGSTSDEGPVGAADGSFEPERPPDGEAPGVDAAEGARNDVVVRAKGYCAGLTPKPKFCDDFDDLDLENDWDQATIIPPSIMDLDDSTFTSAPVSYVVATKLVAAGSSGNISLRKTVLGNVSHVQLAFSALFASTTLTRGLVAIATLDVSTNHFFTLYLRDGELDGFGALEEQASGTKTRHVLLALPPAGAWTRIVLDLDLVTGKANVSFGAQKALDGEPITPLVGTEATVRLGAVFVYGPTDPFQAAFDDVVVDF